jgi:hypothetical protein
MKKRRSTLSLKAAEYVKKLLQTERFMSDRARLAFFAWKAGYRAAKKELKGSKT